MSRAVSLSLLISLAAVLPATARAQWGDVKLTFVYDGKPPAAAAVAGLKMECVLVPPVTDETWVVNPKNGGVQNVVVRLLPEKGVSLPMHPDFEKAKGTSVRIDNTKCRFEPHVAMKYTNQDLVLGNKDPFGHNVKADFFNNLAFNVLIPAKAEAKRRAAEEQLDKHEPAAGTLSCNIHPHMKAYLFISSHPYVGVSDNLGDVTIKNIPQGEWTFVMWHEAGGFIQKGSLGKMASEWKKGRIKIKVGPGLNTVGTVTFKKAG